MDAAPRLVVENRWVARWRPFSCGDLKIHLYTGVAGIEATQPGDAYLSIDYVPRSLPTHLLSSASIHFPEMLRGVQSVGESARPYTIPTNLYTIEVSNLFSDDGFPSPVVASMSTGNSRRSYSWSPCLNRG